MADEPKVTSLFDKLADALVEKLGSADCKAADMAVALAFLKATGAVQQVTPGTPANRVLNALPTEEDPFDDEEEIARQRAIFSGPQRGAIQ